MQNVFDGDNLHEMTKPVFWERKKKSIISLSPGESAQSLVKVNVVHENWKDKKKKVIH